MENLVSRQSCGIHYRVDPFTPSDIYFDQKTMKKIVADGCDMSITDISSYLRNLSDDYLPVLLTWDMTSKCNFTCPFCYIRDNSDNLRDVNFNEAKGVIDDLVEEGLFEVYLSGGECLLLADFIDIYRYFKQKGVFVTVFTNGSLIDDDIIQCWKELPPSSVEITLYSNDFNAKPFRIIEELVKMGIHVLPKFTLTNTTIGYLEDVKKWATERGMQISIDSELFDGIDEKHSDIVTKYSISYSQKMQYTPSKVFVPDGLVEKRMGFQCKSKRGIIQISPDFSVSLCNKMKIRWDLRRYRVKEALEKLRVLIKKYENAPIHGCGGCVYSKKCTMCFANAEIKDGELCVPIGYCEKLQEEHSNRHC